MSAAVLVCVHMFNLRADCDNADVFVTYQMELTWFMLEYFYGLH